MTSLTTASSGPVYRKTDTWKSDRGSAVTKRVIIFDTECWWKNALMKPMRSLESTHQQRSNKSTIDDYEEVRT
jgi:hypothetical protein